MSHQMKVKVAFVIFMIFVIIIGLSALNILMKPCIKRLQIANYGGDIEHELRIEKYRIPEIIKKLDEFWRPYNSNDSKFYLCSFENGPPENKTCSVNHMNYGYCRKSNNYGFVRGEACIFFKLKADKDFNPGILSSENLPEDVPQDLKNNVREWEKFPKPLTALWFSCEGITEDDTVNMGPVLYFPHRGFLSYYFPCKSEFCTDPVVAVYFDKPKRNVTINIKCKVWGSNYKEKLVISLFIE